jgi:hypothetical protein
MFGNNGVQIVKTYPNLQNHDLFWMTGHYNYLTLLIVSVVNLSTFLFSAMGATIDKKVDNLNRTGQSAKHNRQNACETGALSNLIRKIKWFSYGKNEKECVHMTTAM